MRRPIGIDLFAGAGGMSLGFEQAGFDVCAAVEIDPIHCCIHEFNFPNCATIPSSVTNLTGDDIRDISDIEDSEIDVVFGGAPCQGFSLIGQRALDDPRNSLVKDFVRLVSELDAKYFVFENVKGLTIGKHQKFLNEIIEEFSSKGYDVLLPWKVLNAALFGVPQNRERLILMGAKRGYPLPSYPKPRTSPAGSQKLDLPSGPSCYEALADLPNPEEFEELLNSDEVYIDKWVDTSDYVSLLRGTKVNPSDYSYSRVWNRSLLTSSNRTSHTKLSRSRFASTEPGSVEPVSRFLKLPPNGVSNTLRAGTDSARGAFTSPRPIHYEQSRCITVREMARLHSFPDWFRFHSTKWHGARQIGNAVPPLLAQAVACQIIDALDIKPFKPEQSLRLGDSDLLIKDMSKASNYWGIDVPIASRDRSKQKNKNKSVAL